MIWTYDSHKGTVRPSRIEETGAERNFYSVQDEQGRYIDDLEHWFAGVEANASAAYSGLLDGVIPDGQAKADMAVFVSSLYARSPATIRANAEGFAKFLQLELNARFSTRASFDTFMDEFDGETGIKHDRDAFFEFWHDKTKFSMLISQKRGLGAVAVSDDIAPLLFERNWYLIDAIGDQFITSDGPVVRYVEPEDRHSVHNDGGFLNPLSEVTLPLSPSKLLLITGRKFARSHFSITTDSVWAMNAARAYYAERFLYAQRKDPRVQALANEHKDARPRFTFGSENGFAEVKLTR